MTCLRENVLVFNTSECFKLRITLNDEKGLTENERRTRSPQTSQSHRPDVNERLQCHAST